MDFSENEIFFEEPVQINAQECQMKILVTNDNQYDYLTQFINSDYLENQDSSSGSNIKSDGSIQSQCAQNSSEKSLSAGSNPQNSGKNVKKSKSFFHNFQKHLVITLRNVIKLKNCPNKSEVQEIAYEMWNIFVKSSNYSKKFLFVLFGVHGTGEQTEFSKTFLENLGYMEIFAKYLQQTIKQAQKYLRKSIIEQFQILDLKGYLVFRKLKRVDEFQQYFNQFLEQLRQGSVSKRLPKQKKLNMLSSSQKNQMTSEMAS